MDEGNRFYGGRRERREWREWRERREWRCKIDGGRTDERKEGMSWWVSECGRRSVNDDINSADSTNDSTENPRQC